MHISWLALTWGLALTFGLLMTFSWVLWPIFYLVLDSMMLFSSTVRREVPGGEEWSEGRPPVVEPGRRPSWLRRWQSRHDLTKS